MVLPWRTNSRFKTLSTLGMHPGFIGSPVAQNVLGIAFLERTLIRDGADENILDFSPPEGGTHYAYSSFTKAPNGDYIVAYRSAPSNSTNLGSSSLRINISTASVVGRSFMFQKKDEILIETGSNFDPFSTALATISGTIWLTFERVFTGTPLSRTFYVTSSNNGRTWSSASQFPATGSAYTAAGGKVVDLGNGVYLKPDSFVNLGETRRTAFCYRSVDSGSTWATHSVMAQDSDPSGTQYQQPQIIRLQNGNLLGLLRVDGGGFSGTVYQVTSSNNGDTWSSPPTLSFLGKGWPALVQSSNGMIVASMARQGNGHPELFYSTDNASSWTSAGRFGAWLFALGLYNSCGFEEISPNIIGICWAQAKTGSNNTALAFGKFRTETSASLPYVYHQERVVDTFEDGNRGWNFGNNDTILSGSSSFLLEMWLRFRNFNQPGIIFRQGNAGNTQQSLDVRLSGSRVEVTVASSPTSFDRWISPTNIHIDEWYQLCILFSGSGAQNADRLRTWIASGSAPLELTTLTGSSFTGTIPSTTTRLTSGSSRWTLGCFENATQGFRGYISDVRLWDNVNVTTALQNITGNLLYNYRLPIHPASSSLGLPTIWIACDANGNAVDLKNVLTSSTALGGVGYDTYTILGHGWLNISGSWSGDGL